MDLIVYFILYYYYYCYYYYYYYYYYYWLKCNMCNRTLGYKPHAPCTVKKTAVSIYKYMSHEVAVKIFGQHGGGGAYIMSYAHITSCMHTDHTHATHSRVYDTQPTHTHLVAHTAHREREILVHILRAQSHTPWWIPPGSVSLLTAPEFAFCILLLSLHYVQNETWSV